MKKKLPFTINFLKKLNRLCIFINLICVYFCIISGLFLVGIIVTEVIFRYLIGSALSWPEEIAGFLFVWFSMLGAAICLFKKSHINVTFLVIKFNSQWRFLIQTLVHVLIIFISYILLERGNFLLGIVSRQFSAAARINMVWEYSVIPIMGGIFILYSIVSILNSIFTGDDSIRGDLGL